MNDVTQMTLLLDFYGQLLTERQFEVMDLYYNHDFSLAEVSEELVISRQGVHDCIKRSKISLLDVEDKLGLLKKFNDQKNKAIEAINILESLKKCNLDKTHLDMITGIKDCIDKIINDF